MSKVARIAFTGSLPDSFFSIAERVYGELSFRPEEDADKLLNLLRQESSRHELVLYTDHEQVRLMGIFPAGEQTAFFGFWETTNNLTKNKQGFALLEADAREKGRQSLIGPQHFNTFHRYRLRLGNPPSWQVFDREPVNPPYYPQLLEEMGYSRQLQFESRLIRASDIPKVYQDKKHFLDTLEQLPYVFIPLTPETWQEREAEIYELVHAIFSQNPGYRAISQPEFSLLYNATWARKLCPHSSVLFQEKSTGKLVAMSFCQPNYQHLKASPGHTPCYQDFEKLPKKTMLVRTVGVHPNYRQQGLMSYLAAYAMRSFQNLYEEVLFCLMRSDNFSVHFSNDLPYEQALYSLYGKKI